MLVLIKGAGDLASGIAVRLYNCGFKIVMTEISSPMSIRRKVCFSQAIYDGEVKVEGIVAKKVNTIQDIKLCHTNNEIPVMVDPECDIKNQLCPDVLVDAILAKKNLGTSISDAGIVIGVGPGFTARSDFSGDCHAVVETMRGHDLGRVIYKGAAIPNTNIPGLIGGFAGERVLRAPIDGIFKPIREIGDIVSEGEIVAYVNSEPVKTTISGVLRGILSEGVNVYKGLKSGDVDPRANIDSCFTVSDKARAVAGGVLEAILHLKYCLET